MTRIGTRLGSRNKVPTLRGAGVAARFWSKVDRSGGAESCWLWRASINASGYGQFHIDEGTSVRAHRWAYEQITGPIPDGLVLDHLCGVRPCVNPRHLEPVTINENSRRGGAVSRSSGRPIPPAHPSLFDFAGEEYPVETVRENCRCG